MSEDTKKALDDAVRAHFRDETDGGFMTDYVLTSAGPSVIDGDRTEYIHCCSESPFHVTYGLASMAMDRFSSEDDDD